MFKSKKIKELEYENRLLSNECEKLKQRLNGVETKCSSECQACEHGVFIRYGMLDIRGNYLCDLNPHCKHFSPRKGGFDLTLSKDNEDNGDDEDCDTHDNEL